MPTPVYAGRYTALPAAPYVVFLIGMRVNRVLAVNKWLPVMRAMPPMLRELYTNKEHGFLSAEYFLNWRGVTLLQYWKSFEHLHAYAHARDAAHLPAWTAFNRAVGADGRVGIWHETYLIEPRHSETIYGNMPRWGLGRAFEHVAITGERQTARERVEQ